MCDDIPKLAGQLLLTCRQAKITLRLAESCTGGLAASYLTAIAGCSDVFERSLVTYSNQAKIECLGINKELIEKHGAVSKQVARAMAQGVLANAPGCIGASVTGIAGPAGGSAQKPLGLVHFGLVASNGEKMHMMRLFPPTTREEIRQKAVFNLFQLLLSATILR